jgi:integrase
MGERYRNALGTHDMQKLLTDAFIRNIAPPATGRLQIADLREVGLRFRVTANNARSWSFVFRDPASAKSSRSTIGAYPDISLAEARARAAALRKQVAGGTNPIQARRIQRETAPTRTFEALADRYLVEHAERFKRPRSVEEDRRNLKLHVLPKWAGRQYADISRADIVELIEGLVTAGKPTLANRVQALISKIFSFAIDAGLPVAHPSVRLRRRGVERVGRRVLSDDEIRLFWANIVAPPVSPRTGLALRLALTTGARVSEIAGAARAEFEHITEPGRAVWTVPGERAKNGLPRILPLSEPARRTIVAALELIGDNAIRLFPSPGRDVPITGHALSVAMMRFGKSLTADRSTAAASWCVEPPSAHDLRRTLATRLASLGIAHEDIAAVLGHVLQGVTKRHYDTHDRLAEKRRALTLWGTSLTTILEHRPRDAGVVSLAKKQR